MDYLLELMNHGYGAMWVVVGFSVLALAVAVERAIAFWQFAPRARNLMSAVSKCLAAGVTEAALADVRAQCERSPSPLADIVLVGVARHGKAKLEHVASAVHRERLRVSTALKTRLWFLGTAGATAPFVGLFGTVVGIMDAMGGFRGDETVKFAQISGPISAALIVTAAGILVAVVAVVLFNYFSQRAARLTAELKMLTDEYLELLLEPQASKRDATTEPA